MGSAISVQQDTLNLLQDAAFATLCVVNVMVQPSTNV